MKRGLVVLDPLEVTPEEYAQRVGAFQNLLRASGCGLGLIYGDVYRSGDLTYLTNLCLYWNEGILAIPAEGEPAFLTRLSPRVHPWIRSTSTVSDLRSDQDLAALVEAVATGHPEGAVGLVEEAWWPAPLLESVRKRLVDRTVRDLGPAVRALRRRPSGAERRLLRQSARLAAIAVAVAASTSGGRSERVAAAEGELRRAGVRDVILWCDPRPGGTWIVEARVDWRGYWAHAARTVLPGQAPSEPEERFVEAYREAAAVLRAGVRQSQVEAEVRSLLGDLPEERWSVEVLEHVDLETWGEHRPLEPWDEPIPEGAVVSLALRLRGPERGWWVAADTYELHATGADRLTDRLPPIPVWREAVG
ncbi:MAG: hypothetical protein QN193_06880 [Armatimonadota bacterium]|nr:hypothetical protein [Armatimonadota bacterium]MDR7444544.1 hypothetical protein [Armatimonadota bacterium]MDR7570313.1 hypothetical protein [Armatimonadota bacterium]MDR7615335.1 hypothetical protein [Armatimonadota bacterium]